MLNCSKHFMQRWVERIMGKSPKDNDFKEYVTKNEERVKEHGNTTYHNSRFIYKGQIGDNTTKNYYIKDNIVIVTNVTNDALITVYKVDLGLPEELNKTVIDGLIEEIDTKSEEQEEIQETIDSEIEDKEYQKIINEDEIKRLEEQLQNYKDDNKLIESEIKNIKSKKSKVDLEKKKYVQMLVNSKEYRRELQETT